MMVMVWGGEFQLKPTLAERSPAAGVAVVPGEGGGFGLGGAVGGVLQGGRAFVGGGGGGRGGEARGGGGRGGGLVEIPEGEGSGPGAGAAAIGDVAGFDVPQVAAARSQVEPAGVVAGFDGGNGNAGGRQVGPANVEGVAHGGGRVFVSGLPHIELTVNGGDGLFDVGFVAEAVGHATGGADTHHD